MNYPGDLKMRVGRRVCRQGEWVAPTPIDETAKASINTSSELWVCGELIAIHQDRAHVKIFRAGVWEYPLAKLKVNHRQEKMTDTQYLYALYALRQVVSSTPISGYDDTTIGCKSTECNWGFCSDDLNIWPIGRPDRQVHQSCPLDREHREHTGCFYRCRFFRDNWRNPQLVLDLYDKLISENK